MFFTRSATEKASEVIAFSASVTALLPVFFLGGGEEGSEGVSSSDSKSLGFLLFPPPKIQHGGGGGSSVGLWSLHQNRWRWGATPVSLDRSAARSPTVLAAGRVMVGPLLRISTEGQDCNQSTVSKKTLRPVVGGGSRLLRESARGWISCTFRCEIGGVGLGWAGGLMQEQALGCGLPSLPHHEAKQPDCPVPRPSGLSTATKPHRSAGGRKIPSSCV